MSVSDDFLSYVLEQLSGLRGLRPKRMFGAVGVYCEENFFAVIDDDVVYLKTDETTSADFEARGMRRFMPSAEKQGSMGYYEVPADVLEDRDELAVWARKAVAVSAAAASRKRVRQVKAGRKIKPKATTRKK
jgi:DNA transformation protein